MGLGPVGQMLTPYLLERKDLEIVGAVDIDRGKVGRDLGEVSAVGRKMEINIVDSIGKFDRSSADVAVVTTVSSLEGAAPLFEEAAHHGLHVVSTCEELTYPWKTQPELARRLDQTARDHGTALFGTGVNPGFLMDLLPIVLTAVCRDVKRIQIERIQDASKRRLPFQQKIGAGLTLTEFKERERSGKLRHVGLTESVQMIAAAMKWELDKTTELLEPVLTPMDPSRAAGVRQVGRGLRKGEELIVLEFRASVGETNPQDKVTIDGTPSFSSVISGGIHGDIATCAIVTNSISQITNASPGLRTMIDLAPISCSSAHG